MNLVPLKYRVLIKPKNVEEKTSGGIYLPEQVLKNEKLQTQLGILVAIGSESYLGDVTIGDTVMYAKFGGKFVKDPSTGEEYVICNDEDILMKVLGELEFND